MKVTREQQICVVIAKYMALQYPDVIFFHIPNERKTQVINRNGKYISPYGGLLKKMGVKKGIPDLFIDEPHGRYHGLRLEVKAEGVRLKKKDGGWASPHIAEQAKMLEAFKTKNYMAEFSVGFDQTKMLIDCYLSQNRKTI